MLLELHWSYFSLEEPFYFTVEYIDIIYEEIYLKKTMFFNS